jgi:hypothetical protein
VTAKLAPTLGCWLGVANGFDRGPDRSGNSSLTGLDRAERRLAMGCGLQYGRLGSAFLVYEFDAECVISSPDHLALANIIASNLQHEFIRNGISPHAGDLCAAVRKAAQDARTGQIAFQVMDCCRTIPLDPKVLAPLAWHSRIPITGHLPLRAGLLTTGLKKSAECKQY